MSGRAAIVPVLLALLAVLPGGCAEKPVPVPVDDGIAAAVDYIRRMQHPDGSFVYTVHPDTSVRLIPRYNILRHTGVLYALGTYATWSGDTTVAEPVARGVDYLRWCCLWPLDEADSLLPVWSPPELFNDSDPMEAKLGGAGMGLVALVELDRLRPGSVDREEMRGLARFIRYMLKPDGSYYSKYTPSLGGLRDDWTSVYYPGEAALGLAMLAEVDPDPRWGEAALRILGHLARQRVGQASVPPDHWALISTARLLTGGAVAVPDSMRTALLVHARQIAGEMLSHSLSGRNADGRLVRGAGTAPTATRLEGLLALAPVLPADDPLRAWIREAADGGVRFLLGSQTAEGPYRGGVPHTHPAEPVPPGMREPAQRREIRIDYVQHALSAWLAYAAFVGEPPPETASKTTVKPD